MADLSFALCWKIIAEFSPMVTKIGGEILVNTATEGNQYEAQITPLAGGGFVVTWIDESQGVGGATGDSSFNAVKAQVFAADGSKVGWEILVNTITVGPQESQQIAALPDGGFVIVWEDGSASFGAGVGDTSSLAVKAQIFDAAGGKFGGEILVNTITNNAQWEPQIAILENGNFVVTWSDTSNNSVKAQVLSASGTKVGSELLVNTATASYSPQITALEGGGFAIAWQGTASSLGGATGDDSLSVKAQVFGGDGSQIGDEILVNTATQGAQQHPQITALEGGGFVVIWRDASLGVGGAEGDTSSTAVKAQVFAASGTKVGSEILVNSATQNSQGTEGNIFKADLVALAGGGFAVIWTDLSFGVGGATGDSSGSAVKAQVFSADGTKVGGEILVNTVTGGSQDDARISALEGGGFVVVWTGGDALGDDTKAQQFAADGTKIGDEILVNTATRYFQERPEIATLKDGGFVVVWDDFSFSFGGAEGDNSNAALKAQVFSIGAGTASNDFDGDGTSDILWLETASQFLGFYEMSDSAVAGWGSIGVGAAGWTMVGKGDFTGDGTTDLLWQSDTGDVGLYEMSGGAVASWINVNSGTSGWSVVGTGDYNGDGTSDVLWQNDGSLFVGLYEMSGGVATWANIGETASGWSILGSGDFTGDGTDDILWMEDSSGFVGFYEMSDSAVAGWGSIGVGAAGWSMVGVGDFNGDGTDDILWQSDAGDVGFYQMDGGAVAAWVGVNSGTSGWSVAAIGDYNGDGTDDILWQEDATGFVGMYEMHDGVATWINIGTSAPGWEIV